MKRDSVSLITFSKLSLAAGVEREGGGSREEGCGWDRASHRARPGRERERQNEVKGRSWRDQTGLGRTEDEREAGDGWRPRRGKTELWERGWRVGRWAWRPGGAGPKAGGWLPSGASAAAAHSPRNPPRAVHLPPPPEVRAVTVVLKIILLLETGSPGVRAASGAGPRAPRRGQVRGGRPGGLHSWFSMRCISSLMLRAVFPPHPCRGGRPSLSCQGGVLLHGLALPLPPHDGTLMGDKCRDYRGCVRERRAGAPAGREGSGDQRGGRADREKTQLQDGTETPASPRQADRRRWGQGCRRGGDMTRDRENGAIRLGETAGRDQSEMCAMAQRSSFLKKVF